MICRKNINTFDVNKVWRLSYLSTQIWSDRYDGVIRIS